jgi:hypothetical protein
MISHIVLWRFRDTAGGRSKAENLRQAREMLLALPRSIPGILEWEVGIAEGEGEQRADLALNSRFPDLPSLQAYQAHADHLAVVEFLRAAQTGKTVADYEL